MSKVCGDCWADLRPTEYEPNTFIEGKCSRCGAFAFVHRVRADEVRRISHDEPYQTEEQARGRRDLRPQP